MGLSDEDAWTRVTSLVKFAKRFGGVLTVNWHDRSIAPERLWEDFYVRLLDTLTTNGALFFSASDAAAWFRQRRSVVFEDAGNGRACAIVRSEGAASPRFPMRLRVNQPSEFSEAAAMFTDVTFTDVALFECATQTAGIPTEGAMNG
jgi:hypothetical protein